VLRIAIKLSDGLVHFTQPSGLLCAGIVYISRKLIGLLNRLRNGLDLCRRTINRLKALINNIVILGDQYLYLFGCLR
jgi:hypothetical protein